MAIKVKRSPRAPTQPKTPKRKVALPKAEKALSKEIKKKATVKAKTRHYSDSKMKPKADGSKSRTVYEKKNKSGGPDKRVAPKNNPKKFKVKTKTPKVNPYTKQELSFLKDKGPKTKFSAKDASRAVRGATPKLNEAEMNRAVRGTDRKVTIPKDAPKPKAKVPSSSEMRRMQKPSRPSSNIKLKGEIKKVDWDANAKKFDTKAMADKFMKTMANKAKPKPKGVVGKVIKPIVKAVGKQVIKQGVKAIPVVGTAISAYQARKEGRAAADKAAPAKAKAKSKAAIAKGVKSGSLMDKMKKPVKKKK